VPPRVAATTHIGGPITLLDALSLPGDTLLAVLTAGTGDLLVVPLVAEDGGTIRRAAPGDGAFAGIVAMLRAGSAVGRFSPRVFCQVPAGGDEVAIDVDQSNESVVVAGRSVVKLYPTTAPGPQPGLDVPAHLSAVGFTATPTPFGALTWRGADDEPALLASLAAYAPGARDGWDWFVEVLIAALDRDDGREAGDAVDAIDAIDAVAPAGAIGALVARLHLALASPSAVFPSPVTTASRATIGGWHQRALASLHDALELTSGGTGARLRALAPTIRSALAPLATIDTTPTMRIHGDLHVGQILSTGAGYLVSDFDGDPLAPAAERTAPDAPARDVAAMTRALDHVGRIVQRQRPGNDDRVDGWIADARSTFLTVYRASLGERGPELLDERLLAPFEVAQECHEYVYAARFLPGWRSVPDRAMPALLAQLIR